MLYRINLILEVFLLIACIHELFGKRITLNVKFMFLVMLDLVLMQSVLDGYLPQICTIIIYPAILIYCLLYFGDGLKKTIINIILSFVIMSVIQIIGVMLIDYLFGEYLSELLLVFCTYIFMAVVCAILYHVVELKKVSEYFQKPYVIVSILLAGGTGILITGLVLTKTYKQLFDLEYIIVAISAVIILIISVGWIKYKERSIQAECQLKVYELYQESYESLITEIRMRQHEFQNHLNAIYNQHFLYKDYESLVAHQQEYCQTILVENKFSKLLKLRESTVIGFLYGKVMEAENKGINVQFEILSDKILEGIPEYKVVEIVGNLFGNAIDAVKDLEQKVIRFKVYKDDGYHIFTLENTSSNIQQEDMIAFFRKGYSQKGKNRGFGLYSVKKMSKQFGYVIEFGTRNEENINWLYFSIKKEV